MGMPNSGGVVQGCWAQRGVVPRASSALRCGCEGPRASSRVVSRYSSLVMTRLVPTRQPRGEGRCGCTMPGVGALNSLPGVISRLPSPNRTCRSAADSRTGGRHCGCPEHLTANQKVGTRTSGVSGDHTLSTALQMTPHETPWYDPTLKRLENASRAMLRNPQPVSHLRAHPTSTRPYPVLFGNDTTTTDAPADS